ncbi:MAG: aminotransferase class V-fold PLP-dependent enzyme [Caldilineaceae bacterium]
MTGTRETVAASTPTHDGAIAADQPATRDAAFAAFTRQYPDFDHAALADLRARQYARLDATDQVYLDYTGGGLHGLEQVQAHMAMLTEHVLGNPHSHNPTSLAMTDRVEHARAYVLRYFNADPDEYIVVFTPNASGALKHVAESYPFTPDSRFVLTFDNHNSVNGMREFARRAGAQIHYVPLTLPDLRLDLAGMRAALTADRPAGNHLLAFPAQSNFSGVQHSLGLIEEAHAAGWDVMLDAAAFAPTNRLDLAVVKPDFVSLSFYKIFGYPTGIGALIMRREAARKLRRPWFAGGTITIASVQGDGHYLADGEVAFEDGTIDYLNLPAVEIGLRHIERVGIDTIHDRVLALTGWLLAALPTLRHSNGRPLFKVHGPTDTTARGGTITVSFLDPAGEALDEQRIEELAGQAHISVRTGCFCNPGAGEIAHGLSQGDMCAVFADGKRMTFDELRAHMRDDVHKSVASIRISLGIATNFDDVYRFVEFARGFLDKTAAEVGPPQHRDHDVVVRDVV